MLKVAGIKYSLKGRVYYFNKGDFSLQVGDEVIVETERGLQYGFVVVPSKEIKEESLISPLKDIVKIASNNDKKIYQENLKESEEALNKAKKFVDELNLPMNILDANYTFDKHQLLFNFIADDRIDFRELVKKLASIYRTRIELRQIGIRDKARAIGGLGPCGRFLCCNSFLTDLNTVTINMAKNQMLALNPSKINGVCGRLLCCLSYEDDLYTELKKGLPNIGDDYTYNGVNYKVTDINIFKRKVKLLSEKDHEEEIYL